MNPLSTRIPAAFVRISLQTLHLSYPTSRSLHRRSLCTTSDAKASTTGNEASTEELILRFSEAVRYFSKHPPASAPQIGAAPRRSNPFDYNTLMKAFAQAGEVDQVLRLFHEMKESGCDPDVVCYSTVIHSLVTERRPEEAVAVFNEMLLSRLAPDAAAYTILVKLYACYLKRFDSAYEVIRWMVRCGCSPDVVTYSTLITGLCWDGRVQEGLGVLDQMLEDGCYPNVYTFTPLIQAYCSEGRIGEAKMLLDTMETVGSPPNTVTYNILIEALCRIGSFDEVEKYLADSRSKGWRPDTITYSTFMDGLCKWGKADKAFEQLGIMLANGVYPNTVTLNILLDGLCRSSKAWEAKCLLERSAELEWDVDVVNYNTVMSRLCETGRRLAILKLLTDMIKKGINPNTRTISIVIHSLCRAGKLRKAKCLFDSKACVANVVTYTTLIHYFYVAGKLDEVYFLFSKMEMQNVAPNSTIYSIMIDCHCREGKFLEAIDCFHRSLEDGLSQDLVARLTYGLISGGKLREILNLFEQMLGQGLVIDDRVFRSLITTFCRMGYCQSREIYKVCHILDKMLGMR